ncbi:hypothetical protein HDE_05871 [Halotydeus destructor]|nr:hypothetical protein HDE_05871 [Halotydeus destructor]
MVAFLVKTSLISLLIGTISGQVAWKKCKKVDPSVFCMATKDKVLQRAGDYCFQAENCDTLIMGEETTLPTHGKGYNWTVVFPKYGPVYQSYTHMYDLEYVLQFYIVPATNGFNGLWQQTPDKVLVAKYHNGIVCAAITDPNGKLACLTFASKGYIPGMGIGSFERQGKKYQIGNFVSPATISYSNASTDTQFEVSVHKPANVRLVTSQSLYLRAQGKQLYNVTLIGEANLRNVYMFDKHRPVTTTKPATPCPTTRRTRKPTGASNSGRGGQWSSLVMVTLVGLFLVIFTIIQ